MHTMDIFDFQTQHPEFNRITEQDQDHLTCYCGAVGKVVQRGEWEELEIIAEGDGQHGE